MLYKHFTEKILGLQGILIENIKNTDNTIHVYCKLERKLHKCPCCGNFTDKIHDYREQVIKDIPAFGKFVFIHLKKRRYHCSCGKRFAENNSFLPRYHRMTNRLSAYIIDRLTDVTSFSGIAREVNLSVSTVIRIFDFVSYSPKKLPVALSIDEFKGDTNCENYQCVLTDPVNKVVLDILPKRYESYLTKYFNAFSREERSNVKYLFLICGNLTLIFHLFGLKMLLKLLINIIGFGKLSGLLKLFENKSKRSLANPIADILRNPDSF